MVRARGKKAYCRWVIGINVLSLSLGSCAVIPGGADITIGASDRWIVGVSGPRSGAVDPCLDDPIIEESLESANLPSTHLTIKLRETAKKADAERIADCLRRSLTSGDVSIISPRSCSRLQRRYEEFLALTVTPGRVPET